MQFISASSTRLPQQQTKVAREELKFVNTSDYVQFVEPSGAAHWHWLGIHRRRWKSGADQLSVLATNTFAIQKVTEEQTRNRSRWSGAIWISATRFSWVRFESACGKGEVWTANTGLIALTMWTSKSAISKGNSYSVIAIVHLSLKFCGNSSQLPFIWFSLICGRERELEESQVSTTRSDNGVCWSRQVRKKLCENVVTFCSFISNLKQGQEDRISLFLMRRIGLELYVMVDANEAESVQKEVLLAATLKLPSYLSLTKCTKMESFSWNLENLLWRSAILGQLSAFSCTNKWNAN